MVKGVVITMWTRSELKERAKTALHRNYWITVAVTLIVGILTGDFLNSSGNSARTGAENIDSIHSIFDFIPIMWIIGAAIGIITASVIYSIFVGNLFEVGSCRFFEENSEHKARLGLILDGFKNGAYLKNVSTIFFRDLYTFVWTLCLIIPGIVKGYEYKMIPYILAENPTMPREEAFQISRRMMMGQKMDVFVLDLSFIGWFILEKISFGLAGLFFVRPYYETVFAELYEANKQKAYREGYIR